MSEFQSTPQEYLDRHLEPEVEEEPKFGSRPIFQDGFKGVYDQERGVIEHNEDEKKLFARYEKISDDFKERMTEAVRGSQNRSQRDKEELIDFLAGNVYHLEEFKITGKGQDNSEQLLDINEQFTEEGKVGTVLFNPDATIGRVIANKLIFVGGDPVNLDVLLTLEHEIGHTKYIGEENIDGKKRFVKGMLISKQEAARILENERNAWANALRNIKPFMNMEDRKFALEYVHNKLTTYCEAFRGNIAPDWVVSVMDFLEGILPRKK